MKKNKRTCFSQTRNNGAIAILGGMGPQASARMLEVIISMAAKEFGAKNGDDFPEIIVDSIPVSDFISSKKNAQRAKFLLKEKIGLLNNMDVSAVAVACNTAHIMIDDLQAVSKAPFVSMIEAVADEVKRQGLRRVVLLASPSTINARLYQEALDKAGIEAIIPNKGQLVIIERVIRRVIACENSTADCEMLVAIAKSLAVDSVQGIILGCTELPLVFPKDFHLPVFDSIEILSKELLYGFYDGENMTKNKFGFRQIEIVSDERVVQVVGKSLDAIGCDSSVKALVVVAQNDDSSNGTRVGHAFDRGIVERGGQSTLVTFSPRTWDEPRDKNISELMSQDFNLIIVPDMDTLGYDGIGRESPYKIGDRTFNEVLYFRKAKKEIRAFWFMVNDLVRFLDSVDTDYEGLGNLSRRFEEEFKRIKGVKFFSGDGALLEFETRHECLPMADYNFEQHRLGEGGNIPFGEVLITPNNRTGRGSIVLDGSFYGDDTVTIRKPLTLHFYEGRVVRIEGDEEAQVLKNYLSREEEKTREAMKEKSDINEAYLDNIYRIGEFAVGLNPEADFCNDILIDEKVYGSAHIALGRSYHGDPAFVHVDLVVRKPRIVFMYPDGTEKIVLDGGKVLL